MPQEAERPAGGLLMAFTERGTKTPGTEMKHRRRDKGGANQDHHGSNDPLTGEPERHAPSNHRVADAEIHRAERDGMEYEHRTRPGGCVYVLRRRNGGRFDLPSRPLDDHSRYDKRHPENGVDVVDDEVEIVHRFTMRTSSPPAARIAPTTARPATNPLVAWRPIGGMKALF